MERIITWDRKLVCVSSLSDLEDEVTANAFIVNKILFL